MAETSDILRRSRDPDEEVRYAAVRDLAGGEPHVLDALLERLGDGSWRVRKAAVERLAKLGGVVVPRLIDALGAADSAGTRNAAAEALVRIGRPAVAPLVAHLGDGDVDVRKFVVDVLGDIGDPGAVAPLAARLADPDRNCRAAAAEALGKLGGPQAAGALVAALGAEDHLLKVSALDALGRIEAVPPFDALRPLLADRFLRRSVFRLLGRSEADGAVAALVQGLSEPGRGTREAALAALSAQRRRRDERGRAALAVLVRERAASAADLAPACAAALASQDLATLEGAMFALAWIGRPDLAAAVARVAQDDRLRDRVVEALLELGPKAAPHLLDAMGSFGPGARGAALVVLGRFGHEPALPAMLESARGPAEEELRLAAIDAVGALGSVTGAGSLFELLDEPPPVCSAAADALARIAAGAGKALIVAEVRSRLAKVPAAPLVALLGRVGGAEDLPALKAALHRPEAETRAAAAEALGALGDAAVGHVLARALADEAATVRLAAAAALGALGPSAGEEAAAALTAALRDEDAHVVASAAGALGRSEAREAVGALQSLVAAIASRRTDNWPLATIAAVGALARLGATGPRALGPPLRDGDAEVVKAACGAAGSGCEELLLVAAGHARWDVRQAAARALGRLGAVWVRAQLAELAAAERDPMAAEAFANALSDLAGSGE